MTTGLSLILWPAFTGIVLLFFGRKIQAAQIANIAFQLVWIYFLFDSWSLVSNAQTFPVFLSWNWFPTLKSSFALGIDGLNFPLVALNVFLSVILAFYSYGKEKLGSSYLALFSLLNAGSVGSLLASDLLCFYFFWEFMLIPMYFLIGKWGSDNRIYAAVKFFAFTMAGSLPFLFAIVGFALQDGISTLSWHDLARTPLSFGEGWKSLQGIFYLCFLAAFAVKIPIWPVHMWLPDAHSEAPTGASVILAGVLLKLGVYAIARWCLPIFPEAVQASAPVLMALGCVGIVLGSFAAWAQKDIKRIIAYSSVAHLGFMVLGLFSLRVESIQGALFQNIAHGLSTGALFLIFGIIYDRTHSRKLEEYGGLASREAFLATGFVIATLASIGLPGLPGFVGEFLILSGSFMTRPLFALIALSGVLLGAVYMLILVRKMMFGAVTSLVEHHPIQVKWNEWVAVLPLLVVMLILGMMPSLVLNISAVSPALKVMGLK